MRHTTLKQLRFLSAVIKTGTVTAASSAMNVTPPAITAQVKALEDLVGLPLLERVGDRFIATSAGKEIANTLDRIEALLNECGLGEPRIFFIHFFYFRNYFSRAI